MKHICILTIMTVLFSCRSIQVPNVVYPSGGTPNDRFAAQEVQRYIYLRTGVLPALQPISSDTEIPSPAVIIGTKLQDVPWVTGITPSDSITMSKLGKEDFLLKKTGNQRFIVSGGSDVATLYGAYRFAELMGVRFYLHGDVVPDERLSSFEFPDTTERHSPLFDVRGILPFHDFPEGPDSWNERDYNHCFNQMVKLRMNFFGLHTYPENKLHAEPTVWHGLKEDVMKNGDVSYSYPSTYANTLRPVRNWGYEPAKTSDFTCGASMLFDNDVFGADVIRGAEPFPYSPDSMNLVFNRTLDMLQKTFRNGAGTGIRYCVGTETPVIIPERVKERMKALGIDPASDEGVRRIYEGTFSRLAQHLPVSWYWLWTPEHWTWRNPSDEMFNETIRDIRLAVETIEGIRRPFDIALSGWVLGPPADRSAFDKHMPVWAPISCINRSLGYEWIEPGFRNLNPQRPKWAIPWLEDDKGLTSAQLWAGRMRRDASDAYINGCNGLIGIHWRTKGIASNISALAQAAWNQDWNPELGQPYELPVNTSDVRTGGQSANASQAPVAGNCDIPVYQTCRYNMKGYDIKVPNGQYEVTLMFCENYYNETGKRVFDVHIQQKKVASGIDVFAAVGKHQPYDRSFPGVTVDDGSLKIDFITRADFPFVSGIVIKGKTKGDNQFEGEAYERRINAGGGAYADFEADLPNKGSYSNARKRDLDASDFYADWAVANFGKEVAGQVASILTRLDGAPYISGNADIATMPRPASWIDGPGNITPSTTPWSEESRKYLFADSLEQLSSSIEGAGSRERFAYLLNTYRYVRAMGRLGCARGQLDVAMEQAGRMQDSLQRMNFCKQTVLPLRCGLIPLWNEMMQYLLETVDTPGEIGTVCNIEQHTRLRAQFLTLHDEKLARWTGEHLPKEAMPGGTYTGTPRIIVPTVENIVREGESYVLKIILLDPGKTGRPKVYFRPMGTGEFGYVDAVHKDRGVYEATVLPACTQSFEFYIETEASTGKRLVWPATSPEMYQTVVVHDKSGK